MDQQAEYPEEPIYEPEEVHEYEGATVAPPLESAFGKYLREYRLLNSLLLDALYGCLNGIFSVFYGHEDAECWSGHLCSLN